MSQPRIATCCYCGRRDTLILAGRQRHELACAGCGAPLSDLKAIRCDAGGHRQTRPKPPPHSLPGPGAELARLLQGKAGRRIKKRLMKKAIGAVLDVLD
ncbi:hypothetical protein [Mangrovicoccus algicola]|uniref:Uncharacterized protein n=1 Tax=Mangrovicoccus algicola TaxID=2771008 RepID=A0A8J7D0B0_9RHOB|nr:hypothetical protein [Mangrovicoccus algicola]MBE3639208.1 hypothetical protein [Mangrovicoccus algicola]